MNTLRGIQGACTLCGCALHECECPERHAEQTKQKIDDYLNALRTPSDRNRCFDRLCRGGTSFMVRDEVWFQAWPTYREDRELLQRTAKAREMQIEAVCYLCLECLEKRLGRPLVIEDFEDVPLNKGVFFGYEMYRRSTNPPAGG